MKRCLDVRGVVFEERNIAVPGVVAEVGVRYGVRVAPITVIDGTYGGGLHRSTTLLTQSVGWRSARVRKEMEDHEIQ